MLDVTTKNEAFQLKGSLFTLTVLQLLDADVKAFSRQLQQLVKLAPKFFQYAPMVIDLQSLSQAKASIDIEAFTNALREFTMIPVGVRGGTIEQHDKAKAAGLAILSVSKTETGENNGLISKPKEKHEDKQEKDKPVTADVQKLSKYGPSKIITRPVRSGQQVYARGGDLIVVAPVSHGAELLADGSIHVYGSLRGRALAGITGDENARIFCQSMDAELVSVAGNYIVNEALIQPNDETAHQIFLQEGKLVIQPL